MQYSVITDFGDIIAERMRVEHRALAARWFDRLLDLLPVDARDVFPTESLLDHVPSLIEQAERLEQFTRMAAHEWRQQLGALRVGVNLLSVAPLDSVRTQRTLDALGRSVTQLVELTHKLESVARMRDSADNAVVQEISVATVVEEAARQLREMAEARGVAIRVVDSLPTLTGDVGRLELAFVNLLSNAIKYSDADKPSRFVEVSGASADGVHRIFIRDNGIGIPAEALKTVFKRFTRAHADRADRSHVPGIGLGLAIVDDCVRSIGGMIEVESDEGAGTTFVLRLPLTPPPAAAPSLSLRPGPIVEPS